MRLDAILNAHAFMKVERPPELWEIQTRDEPFIRLLGETIAAALGKGAQLGELTLNASNVVVQLDETEDVQTPPMGEYVAVTVSGDSDFGPDATWQPSQPAHSGILSRLQSELTAAGAKYAYVRRFPSLGSFTVFYARETK